MLYNIKQNNLNTVFANISDIRLIPLDHVTYFPIDNTEFDLYWLFEACPWMQNNWFHWWQGALLRSIQMYVISAHKPKINNQSYDRTFLSWPHYTFTLIGIKWCWRNKSEQHPTHAYHVHVLSHDNKLLRFAVYNCDQSHQNRPVVFTNENWVLIFMMKSYLWTL